jgi:hypothetical protein
MALPNIDSKASLAEILTENSYTIGRLQTHRFAQELTPDFDAFQASWMTVNAHRIALIIAAGKADGAVAGADDNLDEFIDTLDKTLLIATKNDRSATTYTRYFGSKPPSQLKKPVLGEELETVRGWIDSLNASNVPAIKALGPLLLSAVTAADAAVKAQIKAKQALADFDTIGEKKALIDSFRSLRSTSHGDLGAMPSNHPEAMLPAKFADRFFLHGSRRGIAAVNSIPEVQAKIGSLQKLLAAAEAHLANLQTAATARAAARQEATANAATLAQTRKEAAAALKKLNAMEKQAKASKKKSR